MDEERKKKIREGIRATKEKRHGQICKVYSLKIDESRLNVKQKESLKMLFVEAKWFYNHLLSQEEDIFSYDCKDKKVITLDKDKNQIERTLNFLSFGFRQCILQQLKQSIKTLSTKKKRRQRVGKLKFKSDFTSLNLTKEGKSCTYRILNKKVKVLGIKKPLVVSGLKQILSDVEFANAKLIKKPSGYYIFVTTYSYPKGEIESELKKDIGLDFGIRNTITTSEGEIFEKISIGETERLKRLQRRFAKAKKGSNNRAKLKKLIAIEYEKIINRKKDKANKIVCNLLSRYSNIYIQDENLSGWQKTYFGRTIQHSCFGTIKMKLLQSKRVRVVDRFVPTTKLCYKCGTISNVSLKDRLFVCDKCGFEEDRDIKAAKTILLIGSKSNVPTVRRDLKLVEKSPNDFCETRRLK